MAKRRMDNPLNEQETARRGGERFGASGWPRLLESKGRGGRRTTNEATGQCDGSGHAGACFRRRQERRTGREKLGKRKAKVERQASKQAAVRTANTRTFQGIAAWAHTTQEALLL